MEVKRNRVKEAPIYIIGIDPGKSGGIAILKLVGTSYRLRELANMPVTPEDILDLFRKYASKSTVAILERVHSRPGNGAKAMFTFGQGFGWLQMALLALEISTRDVTPQKWTKHFELGTKGDDQRGWKNRLKAKAQSLYPGNKVTLATADALLLARYLADTYDK